MSRRARTGAALLAALAILAVPGAALAHPLSFGALVVRERPGGVVDVSFRFSGTETRATGADPVLPERCRPLDAASVSTLEGGGEARTFRMDCGRSLDGAVIGVRGLEGAGVQFLVTVRRADGRVVRALLDDGSRELTVPERETDGAVALRYLELGVLHIATGIDHLLFVLGLFLLARDRRALVLAITAFTLGHSLTLALAALSLVSVPIAPVEVLIAASVLLVAIELARPEDAPATLTMRRPWLVAAGFGLLHGLGFASALAETGLPSDALLVALFSFNCGVEIGQLAFVGACVLLVAAGRALSVAPGPSRAVAVQALGGVAVYFVLDRLAVELARLFA